MTLSTFRYYKLVFENIKSHWYALFLLKSIAYLVFCCHNLFQFVLFLWTFIITKSSLEVAFTGTYKPYINCSYGNFFSEFLMFKMGVEFGFFSFWTFMLYITIFIKITKENYKRRKLGKYHELYCFLNLPINWIYQVLNRVPIFE